jgi:hypothetical protein
VQLIAEAIASLRSAKQLSFRLPASNPRDPSPGRPPTMRPGSVAPRHRRLRRCCDSSSSQPPAGADESPSPQPGNLPRSLQESKYYSTSSSLLRVDFSSSNCNRRSICKILRSCYFFGTILLLPQNWHVLAFGCPDPVAYVWTSIL